MSFSGLLIFWLAFQVLPSSPSTADAWRDVAIARARQGDWAESIRASQHAIRLASTPAEKIAAQVDLMFVFLRTSDHPAAARLLAEIERSLPTIARSFNSSYALAAIGVAYWQFGEFTPAITSLTRAINELREVLPPNQLDPFRLTLASIYIDTNSFAQARQWHNSLEFEPIRETSLYHFNAARIEQHQQHPQLADIHFKAAIAAPDFATLSHSEKYSVYSGYASFLESHKRKAESRPLRRQLEQIYEAAMAASGARHKVTWRSLQQR